MERLASYLLRCASTRKHFRATPLLLSVCPCCLKEMMWIDLAGILAGTVASPPAIREKEEWRFLVLMMTPDYQSRKLTSGGDLIQVIRNYL